MEKPEIVYRYRSAEPREIDAILNGQIWLSSPTEFDDPWDCAMSPRLEALPKEAVSMIERLRIACFTTRNDNTRMWSHYADKHNGLCIGYSTCGASLNSWDIYKVRYVGEIPTNKALSSYDGPDAYNTFRDLVTSKSGDWDDQDEWRYIAWATCGNIEQFDHDELISITFGMRCDLNVKKRLLNTVGFHGHVLFQEVYSDPARLGPCIRDCADQHGKCR